MTMSSSHTFLFRFREFYRRRRLISAQNKIVVAVSGGVDSVVLLDLLAREREHLGLDVIVGHFNHQLRDEESDRDEEFVGDLARSYGLECYVERANTAECAKHAGLGIQEAARNLRYEFLDKLLLSSGYDRISTGHNADDNAETVLLNLFRGAGVQGLAGIPLYRQDRKIIRPLLFAERLEIEEFAQAENLKYRTDSSNQKETYNRNYIRHRILPLVKTKINPAIVQTLQRSADLFRELDTYLSVHTRQSLDIAIVKQTSEELHVSIPRLRSHPVLLQQHMVMHVCETFAGLRLRHDQVSSILSLTEGLTGSWVVVSEQHTVFRDRNSLVFHKGEPLREFRIVVQQNQKYDFRQFRFSSLLLDAVPESLNGNGNAEYVDADKVRPNDLILRTWQDGDAFVPLGMQMKKKISDFFIDAKIPVYEKRSYPVLETKDGEIIWLCGQRIDDRFKVTDETRRVLKLEFWRASDERHG
jgi:tRNA(Ile)-lysidine synthase